MLPDGDTGRDNLKIEEKVVCEVCDRREGGEMLVVSDDGVDDTLDALRRGTGKSAKKYLVLNACMQMYVESDQDVCFSRKSH